MISKSESTTSKYSCESYLLWKQACRKLQEVYENKIEQAQEKIDRHKYNTLEKMSHGELEAFLASESDQRKLVKDALGFPKRRKTKKKWARLKSKFNDDMLDKMVAYRKEGLTYREIAEKYDITANYAGLLIRRHLKRGENS